MSSRDWSFPGDPGGLTKDAPVGSVAWAQRMRVELGVAIEELIEAPKRVQRYVALLSEHDGWRLLNKQNGAPFESFEEYVTAEPPWGLGTTLEEIYPLLVAGLGKRRVQLMDLPPDLTLRGGSATAVRVRAVRRAPPIIQDLYVRELIPLTVAARFGPTKSRTSPKQRKRVERAAQAVVGLTDKGEINRTILRILDGA